MAKTKRTGYSTVEAMLRGMGQDKLADELSTRFSNRRLCITLSAVRIASNRSMKDLAEAAGVSPAVVRRIETGLDRNLRVRDLETYAKGLGMQLTIRYSQEHDNNPDTQIILNNMVLSDPSNKDTQHG